MTPEEFVAFVNKHRKFNVFIHFTAPENLDLIKQHGLLSTRAREEKGLVTPVTGGNEWSLNADRISGMDYFVHMGFRPGHSMEFYAKEKFKPVHLEIRPEVLLLPDAKITLDVSNKSGVVPLSVAEGLKAIDHRAIYEWTDRAKDPTIIERFKAVQKYEILIPNHVPTSFIRNL